MTPKNQDAPSLELGFQFDAEPQSAAPKLVSSVDSLVVDGRMSRIQETESRPRGSKLPRPSGSKPGRSRKAREKKSKAQEIKKFAQLLSIDDPVVLQRACSPSLANAKPRMRLDIEHLTVYTGRSGRKEKTPRIVLAAALLILWSDSAELGPVTVSQAKALLKAIGDHEKNARRGLFDSEWDFLEVEGDMDRLRDNKQNDYLDRAIVKLKPGPANFEKAVAVVRAFCTGQPIKN